SPAPDFRVFGGPAQNDAGVIFTLLVRRTNTLTQNKEIGGLRRRSRVEMQMTETRQITKDNAYDAVSPDDFQAMMNTERYNRRSSAFDKIISATHDHFWDPLDKK